MLRYLHGLKHLDTFFAYIAGKHQSRDSATALRYSAEWLLQAQRAGGNGGYAHSYHLLYGWQPPYPETTGYIIPTLLATAAVLKDDRLYDSAKKAFEWLKATQNEDGSWSDLSGTAQVFDTGQILIGLNYIVENNPDWPGARNSLQRAAHWLANVQEQDGSFVRSAYNNRLHSYYSRVGAAMIKSGIILKDETLRQSGVRNIDWVLTQQDPVGFFDHASFDDKPAFLHTVVYILEGLLDAHALTGRQDILDAIIFNAGHLLNSKSDDDLLRSQYYSDFTIANPHICTTGLAQWAGICFRLSNILNDARYMEEGERSLRHVMAHQVISNNKNIHGALPGSLPITGNYLRMAFPNWGTKFYMDSLMAGPQVLRKKVLFVLPALGAGGAERVLINLMNNLDRKRFMASLLSVRGGSLRNLVDRTIPVQDLNMTSLPLALPKMFRALHKGKPDLVLSTMAPMNFTLLMLRPFFPRTKFVIREAITPSFFLQQGGMRAFMIGMLYKAVYPLSNAVIAPAKMILNELSALNPNLKNLIWLPNPVNEQNLRSFSVADFPKPGIRFIAAGRLHHQKGFDRLVSALKDFKLDTPWFLIILGDGPERAALQSLIEEKNLQDHVILAGYAEAPWGYYGAADAFILPSRWEGLPNVALEALACGTVVLSLRDAGGIHEIAALADGQVRVFDDMDAMIAAMAQIKPSVKSEMSPSLLPAAYRSDAVDAAFRDLLEKI